VPGPALVGCMWNSVCLMRITGLTVYKGRGVRDFLPVQAWEYYEKSEFTSSLTLPLPFSLLRWAGERMRSDRLQGSITIECTEGEVDF
jgi:hypothetical protein